MAGNNNCSVTNLLKSDNKTKDIYNCIKDRLQESELKELNDYNDFAEHSNLFYILIIIVGMIICGIQSFKNKNIINTVSSIFLILIMSVTIYNSYIYHKCQISNDKTITELETYKICKDMKIIKTENNDYLTARLSTNYISLFSLLIIEGLPIKILIICLNITLFISYILVYKFKGNGNEEIESDLNIVFFTYFGIYIILLFILYYKKQLNRIYTIVLILCFVFIGIAGYFFTKNEYLNVDKLLEDSSSNNLKNNLNNKLVDMYKKYNINHGLWHLFSALSGVVLISPLCLIVKTETETETET